MNRSSPHTPETDAIAREAALWVLRLDRQLSAAEQDAYSQWLAADPRHGEAVALHRWGWEDLDRLAGIQNTVNALPDPDLLAPRLFRIRVSRAAGRYFFPVVGAMAAAIAIGLIIAALRGRPRPVEAPAVEVVASPVRSLAAPIERRVLADGSTVELNRGAAIETRFTAGVRRVRLVRGEANFIVAKNPARPFIVSAGGIEVRAVGTVFNVRLERAAIEVLVAEGKVQVQPADAAANAAAVPLGPLLVAGQRAVVALGPGRPAPQVAMLSADELAQRTAWQPRLLDFTAAPLGEIVREFNRRNPVRLVLGDDELTQLRLSASFRSDNVAGFVRLMESDFGMRAEWRGESEVVLRQVR